MDPGTSPATSPAHGPRPGAGHSARPLSRSRSALLETLRAQVEPTTLAALATLSGLHANTVREHLEALVRDGLVRRQSEAPSGRGRPAWLYEATGPDATAAAEYAGPRRDAGGGDPPHQRVTDRRRGRRRTGVGPRARPERGAEPARTAVAARREVVALLDEVGFAPETDARAAVVRLTRCPLLEAAHKYPDVVCGVHLGLAQGALEEYGAPPDGAELLPFAEPGACRLRLARRAR